MRTSKNDNNSFAPYKENKVVEAVVNRAYFQFAQARLDDALDSKMHTTNPVEFQMIVDIYTEAKRIFEESEESLDKR